MKWHALSLLALSIPLFAEAKDDYSFQWLDPDKEVYVLQNRRFEKSEKAILVLGGGLGLSGAYNDTFTGQVKGTYFFSESLGLEAFYSYYSNERNDTFRALEGSTNALPTIRHLTGNYGAKITWAPWYAKINVFNSILYFDWYFSAGVGQVQTQLDTNTVKGAASKLVDETFLAFNASTGHLYHLSDLFLVQLDFSGVYFKAPNSKGVDTWFSDYSGTLGLGVKL